MMAPGGLKHIAGLLRRRINKSAAPAAFDLSAADSMKISAAILSMGAIYGIETENLYSASIRTER